MVSPKRETSGAGGNGAVEHESSFGLTTYYIVYLFIAAVCYWSYVTYDAHESTCVNAY